MNPLKPLKVFSNAITMPFTAAFVIGITYFINMSTAPHHLWFKWVALGMGIAVLSAWARAANALVFTLGLAGAAGLAWMVWKKFRKEPDFSARAGNAR